VGVASRNSLRWNQTVTSFMRHYALLKQVKYGMLLVAFSSIGIMASESSFYIYSNEPSVVLFLQLKTEKRYQIVKLHLLQTVCQMSHKLLAFCLPFRH
jgi:hypothetical protein